MKKIFTFCFFAFALLIGTQSAIAQNAKVQDNTAQVNETALVKAKELQTTLKLSDANFEEIYFAYQAHESKMQSIKTHLDAGSSDYTTAITALNGKLQERLKSILGSDKYKRYLIVAEQKSLSEGN